MTPGTTQTRSPRAVGSEGNRLSDLNAQYGCGPVAFTGADNALYERRLVFDHVIAPEEADPREQFEAVAAAIRDVLSRQQVRTQREYDRANPKQVYYLSMEFLIGRSLANNITNLMLSPLVDEAAREKGLKLAELIEQEPDAGLGNGGLGRLAACFIDSLATLAIPAIGYGLRYDYGIFRQEIQRRLTSRTPRPLAGSSRPVGGRALERDGVRPARLPVRGPRGPDRRAARADVPPARSARMTGRWSVTAGGRSTPFACGRPRLRTSSTSANSAAATSSARCRTARSPRRSAGSSTRTTRRPGERSLRFVQEYFLVACALADIVARFLRRGNDWRALADKVAIQLNDTHPAMAVAELMRILLDQAQLGWDEAWDLTVRTLAYTNHTLLPEALEKWPVDLFEALLPRQLEIIYEINRRFLDNVQTAHPADTAKAARMSLIEEGPTRQVRMANLAIVGTHSTNGVAAIHSELLRTKTVR